MGNSETVESGPGGTECNCCGRTSWPVFRLGDGDWLCGDEFCRSGPYGVRLEAALERCRDERMVVSDVG